MVLLNAIKKYSATLVAINPQNKLNSKHKLSGEYFTNDKYIYWLVDDTLKINNLAHDLSIFFYEQKQAINVDINSFLKLIKPNLASSLINAFFSANAFATERYSLKTDPVKNVIKHNFIIDQQKFANEIKVAQVLAESESFARTLISMPSNLLHADQFEKMFRHKFQGLKNVKFSVLDKQDLIKKKMGLILAVGQASTQYNEPRIIVAKYCTDHNKKLLALVGKGLMFDTGGLNLKPGEAMNTMNADMAGSAIALSTIYALAKLNIKANVVGLATITSNEIGPHAYRVNDVFTSYSGKTVEILNTDAEGRLALADGITYAKRDLKANTIITIATLTGAITVALGNLFTGI
jgi:leucyl aminopeptidase